MKKVGKIVGAALLTGIILSGNVLAASSYTTISSTQSSATGAEISISSGTNTSLFGHNDESSSNSVYVQKVRKKVGPDDVTYQFKIGPDTSLTRYSSTNTTGTYYVKLNPEGALSKGVNGSASLNN